MTEQGRMIERGKEALTKSVGILLGAVLLLVALLALSCSGAKSGQEEQASGSQRTSSPEQTNSDSAPTKKKPVGKGQRVKATNARAGSADVEDDKTRTTDHPGKVTLKIEGSPGAEFSGTCSVGDNENKINGEVPKTFTYEPDGQRLSCEIRKHNSDSGALKVMFTAGGHTNSVQQTSAEGGAITLRYDSDGGANLSLTTSGSGGQANSSSHVSVSQSNATSERNSH
jgi:hypothetical protein